MGHPRAPHRLGRETDAGNAAESVLQSCALIHSNELTKAYQGHAVLRGVSLEVDAGEIFGFVGPNGAGKTTFLKSLVGVVRPDSGSARVAGIDAVANPLAARRKVGYAPGETALYHRMPAADLLAFALAFHEDADLARGLDWMDRFGLPRRQRVAKFSHGMKRKLILIQALVSGAPVLLLDEPMEGLDPDARRQVESILQDEAATGRAILFSSHDLASVERVCHRVAFLRNGRLLETGTVSELLGRAGHVLQIVLREPRVRAELPDGQGLRWEGEGVRWRLEFDGALEQALARISELPVRGIRDASGGLEEVFEALYGPETEDEP